MAWGPTLRGRLANTCRTRGGCMTCTATSGSGLANGWRCLGTRNSGAMSFGVGRSAPCRRGAGPRRGPSGGTWRPTTSAAASWSRSPDVAPFLPRLVQYTHSSPQEVGMLGVTLGPRSFLERIGQELLRIDPKEVSALSDLL